MSNSIIFSLDANEERADYPTRIKVVGIGGGGCNAIDNMINAGVENVEFIALNTDIQALSLCKAPIKLQIGKRVSKGLGVGANPEIGMKAAMEDEDRIKELLAGADMVFITCGMGGGTGTGASPIIAKIAKEVGALTVAVVTKPFSFEGVRRNARAEEGVRELRKHIDSIITIPNQKLVGFINEEASLVDAFMIADDILRQAIQGISDLITTPGRMNADFADVKAIMSHMGGRAVMGTATATGTDRALVAAREAMANPLHEDGDIKGAAGILFNITGGLDLKFHEMSAAADAIHAAAAPDANIIPGFVLDEKYNGAVTITIIATGFEQAESRSYEYGVAQEVKELFPRLKETTKEKASFIRKSAEYYMTNNSPMPDEYDKPTYQRRQSE